MTEPPIRYGPNSPFDTDERDTIERIYQRLTLANGSLAREAAMALRRQMVCLEWLAQVLSEYPSPQAEQTLGPRHRGLQTLVEVLCHTNPTNIEFHLPTRALLGRALVMAEANFYRLLRYVCGDLLADPEGQKLREAAADRLRYCVYAKVVDEVLSSIASDNELDDRVRASAVVTLVRAWEGRVTNRIREFFPLLEAAWEARQRLVGTDGKPQNRADVGTLLKFEGSPQIADYFARADLSADETGAWREFLGGASTEELDRLAQVMAANGADGAKLRWADAQPGRDAATVFYEFFFSRHLRALACRLANLAGPRQTAEAYLTMWHLSRPS